MGRINPDGLFSAFRSSASVYLLPLQVKAEEREDDRVRVSVPDLSPSEKRLAVGIKN